MEIKRRKEEEVALNRGILELELSRVSSSIPDFTTAYIGCSFYFMLFFIWKYMCVCMVYVG